MSGLVYGDLGSLWKCSDWEVFRLEGVLLSFGWFRVLCYVVVRVWFCGGKCMSFGWYVYELVF